MTVVTYNTGYSAYLLGMAHNSVVGSAQILELPFQIEEERDWKIRCCTPNVVMASKTSNDLDKNDMTALIFRMSYATDVITFALYKNGSKVADIDDQTHGRYWNIGDITYYPDQALMCGVELDWLKILNLYDYGTYYVAVTINGETFNTMPYLLQEYDIYKLDGTVKIESYMNGILLRKRLNYKELNIRDCLRTKGSFGYVNKEVTVTNDLFSRNGSNRRELIQRELTNIDIYTLELLPIPECLGDKILNYHFMANQLYISDYNANNYSYNYNRILCYADEAPELNPTKTTREIIIKQKLKESVQDNQKKNYF